MEYIKENLDSVAFGKNILKIENMRKKIYIVGGLGLTRELQRYINDISKYEDIEFAGFLGHNGYGEQVDYCQEQHWYKGDVLQHKFEEDEYCVIGAGFPKARKAIYEDLKKLGVKFYTIFWPKTEVPATTEIGEANIFIGLTMISVNAKIGNANLFNGTVAISHDRIVGDYNFFGPKTIVLGRTQIGNENTVGANSIIMADAKVGNNNKITPLSVIYKKCKNNGYYAGNPALKIGDIEEN